ncbi:hypothetical protein C8R43DRAFT_962741 [Mycena crocata]|nr:hypothetical protein C8R43DRAFT_962741 [Mycena crocata]
MSLNCIAHLIRSRTVFPADLAGEFWPRIWTWIKFLHRFRDCVPVVLATEPTTTYSTYGILIAHFGLDLMDATPGLKVVITAAWKVLLRVDGQFQEETYILISQLIKPMGMSTATRLTDLVEGAGGNIHDLISLLMLHIRCSIWTPRSLVSSDTINGMLFDGTRLLGHASGNDPAVDAALLSRGVVKTLIQALSALVHSDLSWQSTDTTLCFVLHPLLHFLNVPPGYPTVLQALKAGLLRLVVDCAHQSETVTMHYLKRVLQRILTPATVYYSVLLELQKHLADVSELMGSPACRESRIFPDWSQFADLANARIRLMDEYNAGMHLSRKVCNNMDCSLFKEKTEFLRCSVCQEAYYCTVDCQAADWAASHQKCCRELSLARLHRLGAFSKRNISFLRVLVNTDYQRSRREILVQHMFEGRANPPTFSTVWLDYTVPEGLQLTAPQTPFPTPITSWDMDDEQRLNSGSMQNHHVVLAKGSAKATLLFLMNIRNPTVRNELRRISGTFPEGLQNDLSSLSPEIRDEINALLAIAVEEIY